MTPAAPIRVANLYRFAAFSDPAAHVGALSAACAATGLTGTLLLAREGINGTIAGSEEGVAAVLDAIRALPGCADLDVKNDRVATMPFTRLKVRLKAEIVTMGVAGIDPARDGGIGVEPAEWNALLADPDLVLIDARNAFEVAVGTFAGAISPELASFRDFPAWFHGRRAALLGEGRATKVAMFCTGGIRCEKASALLRTEGVETVYQLQGGILRYLETVPASESLWRGECFVFDGRVAVGHGLAAGTHSLCHGCRRAVSPADRASPAYRLGVQCPACATERLVEQRRRYAERQRQKELALAREAGSPSPRQAAGEGLGSGQT